MIKDENISISDIIKLWSEAFGDSREDILFFIHNVKNAQCIMYYECAEPAAMLYLVDCETDTERGKYIYAACTSLKYRNKGYMTLLLNDVKERYGNVCLIPAENWLIRYYQSRGFTQKKEVGSIRFFEPKEIEEYLFDGCELEEPFALLCKGD